MQQAVRGSTRPLGRSLLKGILDSCCRCRGCCCGCGDTPSASRFSETSGCVRANCCRSSLSLKDAIAVLWASLWSLCCCCRCCSSSLNSVPQPSNSGNSPKAKASRDASEEGTLSPLALLLLPSREVLDASYRIRTSARKRSNIIQALSAEAVDEDTSISRASRNQRR